MTRWKSDETQFPVRIQYNEKRGSYVVIPKPILESMDKPQQIVFELKKNGNITIKSISD